MVSWPLVHCLLVIFCIRVHLHTREIRSELFCCQFHMSSGAPLSILLLACNLIFQHKGYKSKYEFWLYFSTKGMNRGPKAVIPTCSQVISIMLSGELSNSSDTLLLCSAEGTKVAFQVYLLLENVGGPEKDRVLL